MVQLDYIIFENEESVAMDDMTNTIKPLAGIVRQSEMFIGVTEGSSEEGAYWFSDEEIYEEDEITWEEK